MAKKNEIPPAPRFQKSMLVAEALDLDPRAEGVFLSYGLPCSRCIVADHETIAEGCTPLALDPDAVVARLNALPAP